MLVDYFPTPLRERFADRMAGHRLRREIVTTALVNEAVNRGGMSFVFRARRGDRRQRGRRAARVRGGPRRLRPARAVARRRGAGRHRSAPRRRPRCYLEMRRLLDRAVRWLVTNRRSPIDVTAEIARLRPGVADAAAAAAHAVPRPRAGRAAGARGPS